MTEVRRVLFIQGGGAGAYAEWDQALVDSLRRELGDRVDVAYPRMPDEENPDRARWGAAIRAELEELDDGTAVIGHSIGGTMLIAVLAESRPVRQPAAIVLIAAPFVGDGGWSGDGMDLPPDLGTRLPPGASVHIFQGLDDAVVPPGHADLYARAIPQAQVHRLPGRDHQLNNRLVEVAEALRRR